MRRSTARKARRSRFEVEQGKLKDLTEKQKLQLIMQADAVDTYAEALRQAKVGLEFENQTKQIDANTAALALNAEGRALAAASQELKTRVSRKARSCMKAHGLAPRGFRTEGCSRGEPVKRHAARAERRG